jgi:hypothetical protein
VLTKDEVVLHDGVFQVELTISDAEAAAIFADPSTPVYIEVKDVTHGKTYPRQRFNVIPYALRVPVDGMTIGYTPDGRLESLVGSSSGDITEVTAGTGLLGGGVSGSVTLSLDPTAIPASEPPIAPGTAAQYWTGDKTWATLNADAVPPTAARSYYSAATARSDLLSDGAISDGVTTSAPTQNSIYDNIIAKKGAINGFAGLDGSGKIPVAQLPFAGLSYKGTWHAGTNTPTLTSGACGTQGEYYITSAGGTTSLDGNANWTLGDWAICGASGDWQRVGNSSGGVSTINGQTGATITLTTDDVSEGATNKYFDSASQTMLDDHETRLDTVEADVAGKAASVHTHAQTDVTGLVAALADKAESSHTHAQTDVTGLAAALAGKADASHTHAQAEVTGLSAALAGKADASHTHAQAEVTGLSAALAGKADSSHTHGNADLVVGIDAAKISGGTVSNAEFNVLDGISTGTSLQAQLDDKAASAHAHSSLDASGGTPANALVVDSNGYVGIGTSSPQSLLEVVGDDAKILRLRSGNADHGYLEFFTDAADQTVRTAYIGFPSAGSEVLAINNLYTAGRIGLYTGGSQRISITNSGEVGIGTTNPAAKLHVGGTAGVDGIMFPDGTLQTSANSRKYCGNTASSYTGSTVGGYAGAATKCAAATGCGTQARMCTQNDIFESRVTGGSVPGAEAWIVGINGSGLKDCGAWGSTSNNGVTAVDDPGSGMVDINGRSCSSSYPIACCN